MKFQGKVKVGEMVEGKKYPVAQKEDYSTGVWISRNGDELTLQHFWSKYVLDDNEDNFYVYDEKDGVCYERESNQTYIAIHKNIMQAVEEAKEYKFEDITLDYFYDYIFMDFIEGKVVWGDTKLPSHFKECVKYYDQDYKKSNYVLS